MAAHGNAGRGGKTIAKVVLADHCSRALGFRSRKATQITDLNTSLQLLLHQQDDVLMVCKAIKQLKHATQAKACSQMRTDAVTVRGIGTARGFVWTRGLWRRPNGKTDMGKERETPRSTSSNVVRTPEAPGQHRRRMKLGDMRKCGGYERGNAHVESWCLLSRRHATGRGVCTPVVRGNWKVVGCESPTPIRGG